MYFTIFCFWLYSEMNWDEMCFYDDNDIVYFSCSVPLLGERNWANETHTHNTHSYMVGPNFGIRENQRMWFIIRTIQYSFQFRPSKIQLGKTKNSSQISLCAHRELNSFCSYSKSIYLSSSLCFSVKGHVGAGIGNTWSGHRSPCARQAHKYN